MVSGELTPDAGQIRRTNGRVAYLSQRLDLLDLDRTVADLDSVEQLEGALDAYEGAFVVVSHDERFLRAIRVGRWLRLAGGRLGEAEAPDQV